MEILSVYLYKLPVGELHREETKLSFRYFDSYLQLSKAVPLSRHLPLTTPGSSKTYYDADTRAFFENLLPEAGVRERVARSLGLSPENIFGLLQAIGGDCAGAVSVIAQNEEIKPSGGYKKIARAELVDQLARLPAHPFLAGDEGVRLSLAGAQNKLPIYYQDDELAIPLGSAASSHILKTQIPGLENTVINEAFCMDLASRVGLPAPAVTVVEAGEIQVYMVERFDRLRTENSGMLRLHQEDFCQALGVPPALKYEKEGGPGFSDCFSLVRSWSSEPLLDVALLLRWALFNFLIGNADAHAKNISFLYVDGTVRLTPFYDLISTAVYGRQIDNKFAMKMGGQKDPRYLSAGHLQKFAQEVRVGGRAVTSELQKLTVKMEKGIVQLVEEYRSRYDSPVIVGRLQDVVGQRLTKAKFLL